MQSKLLPHVVLKEGVVVLFDPCNLKGGVRLSFVRNLQHVPRLSPGVQVYDMSLTCVDRLRVVGCGLKGTLVRQLSQGLGCNSELHMNSRTCNRMMLSIVRRIASKQWAAARDEAAKEAEELCALGQFDAALVPLQRAIDLGHLPSRALMAWLLIDGREGIVRDPKRGFELVKEGTHLGCGHCQGVMAYYNLFIFLYEVDVPRSLELARESSGLGSKYGHYTLGLLYDLGRGGLAKDCIQTLAFYRLAAAQGLDAAEYRLGNMYYIAKGVAQDIAEALRLFLLAAEQGYSYALLMVANCYEHGEGVAADVSEAIRWYRLAQAAGHFLAEANLWRLSA